MRQHPQRAGEIGAGRGQPVRVADGAPRVGLADDQAVGLQALEPLRQDVWGAMPSSS